VVFCLPDFQRQEELERFVMPANERLWLQVHQGILPIKKFGQQQHRKPRRIVEAMWFFVPGKTPTACVRTERLPPKDALEPDHQQRVPERLAREIVTYIKESETAWNRDMHRPDSHVGQAMEMEKVNS
jgi:hypothetical protein